MLLGIASKLTRTLPFSAKTVLTTQLFGASTQTVKLRFDWKIVRMVQTGVAEYGSWKSPITSDLLTAGSRSLAELQVDSSSAGQGKIYWAEVRFSEKGRSVVCSYDTETDSVTDWTPSEFNARTKVHEYGGGSFLVHEGVVFFSNFSDQRIYRQNSPTESPQPITSEGKQWRFADGCFGNNSIYCVLEDHDSMNDDTPPEPKNSIVRICAKTGGVSVIAEGADFYASPRLNPSGTKLVWFQWNHPNMPWDATEVWTVDLDESGNKKEEGKKVAGDNKTSFIAPRFAPSGSLFAVGDQTDWWNIYEIDTEAGKERRNLFPVNSEIGEPNWQFGYQSYSFDLSAPNEQKRVAFATAGKLYLGDRDSGEKKELETGFSGHRHVHFGRDGLIYTFASHSSKPATLISVNPSDGNVKTIRTSSDTVIDEGYISVSSEIKFPTGKNREAIAYGHFYPPMNKDYLAPEGTLPPLLVMAHGGPTGQAGNGFDLKKQYWTSRGFAILDVNYRGSTGYGRIFRDSLKGQMGLDDIEDCCEGARHLVEEKKVDGARLCISGGSAGGYVVLRAISIPDVFSAGISRYGISDLELLQSDTHKFEAKYNFLLVAKYPEHAEIFKDRSPINHLDKICCPVGFFQGLDDKIVPPNQTRAMYDAVQKKGFPTMMVEFEGEGHGFRKGENIKLSIDGEYLYFCRVLGIEPAMDEDISDKLNIVNLPDKAKV